MASISKILELDDRASSKSPASSDNGFESFEATSSPEHHQNLTKISTESGSDSGRVSSVEDYAMKVDSMDSDEIGGASPISNSKNFRPWEVESSKPQESRVPELGLHNNPFGLGAIAPPLGGIPNLFHGLLPGLQTFPTAAPSFGHQLALQNFLQQSQNYMAHQKALAALRLKSEFEQFSGARKSAQRQDAWQSVIPGTPSIASSFPHLPPKTPEPVQSREIKKNKDEDNEENAKIAKTKKEPGVKPYKCPICDAQFNRPANLKTHLRIHSGEKPYKCDTCSARFVQVAHLRAHMLIHTGEKPYPCQICGTRFRHLQTLKSHIRIHTGEKPFSCDECSLRFRHKSQLRLHLRTKHGINTNTKKSYTYVPGLKTADLSKIVKETKTEATCCSH